MDGARRLFTGGVDDFKSDLAALQGLGVETFMFRFVGKTMSETNDAMTEFAANYISG